MIFRGPNTPHGRGRPGAAAPVSGPAWLAGKALNEWFEIPGTAGEGGAQLDIYSGAAFKQTTSEIISAASGGHKIDDNRVTSIRLDVDSPVWVQRIDPSPTFKQYGNYGDHWYNPDGKPVARHVYSYTQYVPATDRVVMCGAYGVGWDAYTSAQTDAVNLGSTWTWDAENVNPDVPGPSGYDTGGYGNAIDNAGRIYTSGGQRWTDLTRQWDTHTLTLVRMTNALDISRNRIFSMQFGDGWGYNPELGIQAYSSDIASGISTPITLTGSAVTQFNTDAPTYSALDYDVVNDQFCFYCGQGSGRGRIYVVKPNGTTSWPMTILQLGSGTILPVDPTDHGVHKRFQYSLSLRGFWLISLTTANIYFIRTG